VSPSAEEPPISNLTADFDPACGTIRIRGEGFWSLAQVKSFTEDFKALTSTVRAQTGPLRVLLDTLNMPPQSLEVIAFLDAETSKLYYEGDRVAIILNSTLLKLQAQRMTQSTFEQRVFGNAEAAKAWLNP